MSKDILNFKPAADQEHPLYQLGEAFEALAAAYVSQHKSEDAKETLARDLMRTTFQKCISCRAEGRVINIAAIELCPDADCPLHKLNSEIAAGVMLLTGDKESSNS